MDGPISGWAQLRKRRAGRVPDAGCASARDACALAGCQQRRRMASSVPAESNADGKADLVWQHVGTGQLAVWYMNDLTMTSTNFLQPSSVTDTNWRMWGCDEKPGRALCPKRTSMTHRNLTANRLRVCLIAWLASLACFAPAIVYGQPPESVEY